MHYYVSRIDYGMPNSRGDDKGPGTIVRVIGIVRATDCDCVHGCTVDRGNDDGHDEDAYGCDDEVMITVIMRMMMIMLMMMMMLMMDMMVVVMMMIKVMMMMMTMMMMIMIMMMMI